MFDFILTLHVISCVMRNDMIYMRKYVINITTKNCVYVVTFFFVNSIDYECHFIRLWCFCVPL